MANVGGSIRRTLEFSTIDYSTKGKKGAEKHKIELYGHYGEDRAQRYLRRLKHDSNIVVQKVKYRTEARKISVEKFIKYSEIVKY